MTGPGTKGPGSGRLALLLAALAGPVQAEDVYLCWVGANGWSMTGIMTFPDELSHAARITAADVTGFQITGWLDGRQIGGWNLKDSGPETTFVLNYSPAQGAFLMGGNWPGRFSQGWNANGDVTDCGAGGFGFNAGNYAQDVCLDGRWVEESGVPPPTPLYALSRMPDPDCRVAPQISALPSVTRPG